MRIVVFYILPIFLLFSCDKQIVFKELENGNIISSNNIEYEFFSNEGYIITFGESKFLGKVKWEYPKLHHLGGFTNTGIYSCNDQNYDIVYRIKPDNEWRTYYRNISLPKIELTPENCTRFEFTRYKNTIHFENNISPDLLNMTFNEGITDTNEIKTFLDDIKHSQTPEEAGLYKMITKENGMLENCYLLGYVYGYFDNEINFALSYSVWSFNDLGYSIQTDFGQRVLSKEWLEKLGYGEKYLN